MEFIWYLKSYYNSGSFFDICYSFDYDIAFFTGLNLVLPYDQILDKNIQLLGPNNDLILYSPGPKSISIFYHIFILPFKVKGLLFIMFVLTLYFVGPGIAVLSPIVSSTNLHFSHDKPNEIKLYLLFKFFLKSDSILYAYGPGFYSYLIISNSH